MGGVVINNDCLIELKKLQDNSIDLICTDPPYGYSFMGKDWDKAVPSVEIWKECLRVLKAGALCFVMSSPRQDVLSQMIVRLSTAGFDMSFTSIYWTYSSGFPKAHNIGKAVDKRNGVEREIIGKQHRKNDRDATSIKLGRVSDDFTITKGNSPLEGSYGGFQPKPAVEVIIVCMKPMDKNTFVDQALSNGKGITWLDDCRIPYQNDIPSAGKRTQTFGGSENTEDNWECNNQGRFPANLLVSDDVLNNGEKQPQGHWSKGKTTGFGEYGGGKSEYKGVGPKQQTDSYSRYFDLDKWADTLPFIITPKASKKEKNAGCDTIEPQRKAGADFRPNHKEKAELGLSGNPYGRWNKIQNNHPCVKPLKLMSYLITMGSRPNDIILDPFAGSGSTLIAAKMIGRKYIGMELDKGYCEIAEARLSAVDIENKPEKKSKKLLPDEFFESV